MNASEARSDWLQQVPLDSVIEFRVDCETIDLAFESDPSLSGVVQLIVEPAQHAPVLVRSGSELRLDQKGRYRGRVTPLVRLPAERCPDIFVNLGKGDVALNEIPAGEIALNLGMGDFIVRGGPGEIALKLGKGDVAISDCSGAIAASVGMGDIAVNRCQGSIAIDSGRGDVALSRCGADVQVRLGAGDITVGHPDGGHITLITGSGDVGVGGGNVNGLMARTSKGDITSTARLVLRAEDVVDEDEPYSGDDFREELEALGVNLGDLAFEANDEGLRIARGDRELLRLGHDGIQISAGKRKLTVGHSGISFGAGTASGPDHFSFDTGKGDIHVDLPSDLALRVEILATGDVRSDVPLVSVGRPGPKGSTKRLVGVRDGGETRPRANVRLKTSRGDVDLRTVRVAALTPAEAVEPKNQTEREERERVILEALSRGDLSVSEAERLLAALERSGS